MHQQTRQRCSPLWSLQSSIYKLEYIRKLYSGLEIGEWHGNKNRVGSGGSGLGAEGVIVLNRVVRIDPLEKVTCEQRLEGGKGVSQVGVWGKNSPAREKA